MRKSGQIVHHVSLNAPKSDYDECLLEYARSLWRPEYAYSNTYCGELRKMSAGLYKRWSKRYFVLKDRFLFYFKRREDTTDQHPLGILFLDETALIEMDYTHDTPFCVRREYLLSASRSYEFDGWIVALRQVCFETEDYALFPSPGASSGGDLRKLVQRSRVSLLSTASSSFDSGDSTRRGTVHEEATSGSTRSGLTLPRSRVGSFHISPSTPVTPIAEHAFDLKPQNPYLSSILSPIYSEAHHQIFSFVNLAKNALNGTDRSMIPNMLEPATNVIRTVRQLLYFADGNYAKRIRNPDLGACITKHISVIIERSRRVGFHAKRVAEGCADAKRCDALLRELGMYLDELANDLSLFVSVSSGLAEIDEAFTNRNELLIPTSPVTSQWVFDELIKSCITLAQSVNSQDKSLYGPLTEQLLVLSRAFVTTEQSFHIRIMDTLNSSTNASNWTIRKRDVEKFAATVDRYRNELKQFTSASSDVWAPANADMAMMQAHLCLSLLILRMVITLSSDMARSQYLVGNFWETFEQLYSSFKNQRRVQLSQNAAPISIVLPKRSVSDPPVHEGPLPSPVHPILEDIEAAFLSTESGNSVRDTVCDVEDLTSRVQEFVMQAPKAIDHLVTTPKQSGLSRQLKPPLSRVKTNLPVVASKEYMASDFSVNQVVAKAIGELSALVLECAEQMDCQLNDTPLGQKQLEKIHQIASEVIRACHQIEEELGALEGHLGQFSSGLEGSRQSLSRSVFCFEMSLKTLSGSFIPHDAPEQVASDLDCVVRSCGDVIEAVRAILTHQASLMGKSPSGRVGGFLTAVPPSPPEQEAMESVTEEERLLNEEERRLDEEAEKNVDVLLRQEDAEFEVQHDIVFRTSDEEPGEKSLVKGGSLERLVEKLTYHKMPSADFMAAFLLTYRSFTTASDLLDLLIKRYNVEPPVLDDEKQRSVYIQKKIIPIRLRVFNVIKMWIKNNYEDFESDESLLKRLYAFLPTMRADFHRGTMEFQSLLDRKARGEHSFGIPQSFSTPPPPVLPKAPIATLGILDIDPLEVARQLTLIQWDMFVAIQPNECLNQSWNRKELHHRSPHIRQMIMFSNFVVNWVSTEIVSNESVKIRANYLKYFIQVANKLRLLNNFDGLKGVLCGLQASGVRRLRKTWDIVPAKLRTMFEDMENLMLEEKSFKNYRQILHTLNPPCIPFIGIYLTDLTMIETGNPDTLQDKCLINFHKRYLIAQVIQEIKQYQGTPYSVSRVDDLASWIRGRTANDAQQVYDRSLVVEPRQ